METLKKWRRRMYKYAVDFSAKERKISTGGGKCHRCGCSIRQELFMIDDVITCGLCAVYMGKMFRDENGRLYRQK